MCWTWCAPRMCWEMYDWNGHLVGVITAKEMLYASPAGGRDHA